MKTVIDYDNREPHPHWEFADVFRAAGYGFAVFAAFLFIGLWISCS